MANYIGFDLGTMNLKMFNRTPDEITKIKNTVAIVKKNLLYAYGDDAYDMFEKAPERISVSFPIVNGVIADYGNMQNMIIKFLEHHSKGRLKGSDFIIAVPTDITEVEKKAFFDLLYKSKLKPKTVLLCDKPIANAMGLGLDANEPTGVMIVDIGSDTTEISVVSLGGLVITELLHFGGRRLDESIINYIRRNDNLIIGQKTAMLLKEQIGNAFQEDELESYKVVGMNVVSGLPVEAEITSDKIYNATKDNLSSICSAVRMVLEKTPPEIARDIVKSGIYITGGSSLYRNLDKMFEQISGIKVNTCEHPDETVVRGLAAIVSDPKNKNLAYTMKTKVFK
jgi:rod shape-determining protein MreB